MLILMRRVGQKIMIGEDIEIEIKRVERNQVFVGVKAPKNVSVHREEIFEKIKREGFNENYSSDDEKEDDRGNA